MKKFLLLTTLILIIFLQLPAFSEEALKLTIQCFYERGHYGYVYYDPPANIIKLSPGPSRPFKIVLKNTSQSTQRINADFSSGGLNLLTFEMEDEKGNKNIVTRKIDPVVSKSQGYDYLGAGKTKEFEIVMSESEWNNAFKLLREGATKVRARVSYKNGSDTIYSDYYTLVLDR